MVVGVFRSFRAAATQPQSPVRTSDSPRRTTVGTGAGERW